jgi:hypothetical protein
MSTSERAHIGPQTRTRGCSCAHDIEGVVTTTMLCPLHASTDPCLTIASVTGKRRHGTIRRGVCTSCGWSAATIKPGERLEVFVPGDALNPDEWVAGVMLHPASVAWLAGADCGHDGCTKLAALAIDHHGAGVFAFCDDHVTMRRLEAVPA